VRGLEVPLALLAAGLAGLVVGARLLVSAAEGIAGDLGVPEFVIASSIIAVGTSVPELATGVVAARRGQADIAIGNVIGSNIFNLLGVLGVAAAIRSIEINDTRLFDMYVMLLFSIAGLYLARTGRQLARWEGGALLGAYAGFTALLYAQ
jgi:cation:H+ antiporter